MTESSVAKYRSLVASKASDVNERLPVKIVIDATNVSATMANYTSDGVHYSAEVNDATVQLVLNSLSVIVKRSTASSGVAPKSTTPKAPDSMSFPGWGLAILATAAVMLFTMDSFFGVAWLSLLISGRSYDYMEAYGPLLKKFAKSEPAPKAAVLELEAKRANEC